MPTCSTENCINESRSAMLPAALCPECFDRLLEEGNRQRREPRYPSTERRWSELCHFYGRGER